jgi:hypothetical protein
VSKAALEGHLAHMKRRAGHVDVLQPQLPARPWMESGRHRLASRSSVSLRGWERRWRAGTHPEAAPWSSPARMSDADSASSLPDASLAGDRPAAGAPVMDRRRVDLLAEEDASSDAGRRSRQSTKDGHMRSTSSRNLCWRCCHRHMNECEAVVSSAISASTSCVPRVS